MDKKIIFLFFMPIINNFEFNNQDGIKFINFNEKNKILEIKNLLEIDKWVNLFEEFTEILEELKKNNWNKIVFVNYPKNLQHLQLIKDKLIKNQEKKYIILLNINNFELLLEIQREYLICPFCTKIHKIKEEEKFTCLYNSNISIDLNEIKDFNKKVMNYYLENNKEIINFLIDVDKIDKDRLIPININNKEDILKNDIQKKIIEEINKI